MKEKLVRFCDGKRCVFREKEMDGRDCDRTLGDGKMRSEVSWSFSGSSTKSRGVEGRRRGKRGRGLEKRKTIVTDDLDEAVTFARVENEGADSNGFSLTKRRGINLTR
ncbi:hypothetical protein BHM03_00021081 [Ensete ventricosum]|nr:hypothetical protein BHM03_00021081 [Ensete ventricosum]